MRYLVSTGYGPNRAERRSASKQARLNRVTSYATKRMDRPEKADMVARGYMKLQNLFFPA